MGFEGAVNGEACSGRRFVTAAENRRRAGGGAGKSEAARVGGSDIKGGKEHRRTRSDGHAACAGAR